MVFLLSAIILRRGTIAIIAALVFGYFQVPHWVYQARLAWYDMDAEYILSDGRVQVRNRGPLEFTLTRGRNPYGGRSFRGKTTLADGMKIGFSIFAVRRRTTLTTPPDCVTQPGPYGLVVIPVEENDVFCRPVSRMSRYTWTDQPDGIARIDCDRPGNPTYCGLRYRHDALAVRVFMWQVELSRWREVRDHVNAILDQSFTAMPE